MWRCRATFEVDPDIRIELGSTTREKTMQRLRRLSAIWNWLPVFRAVAELEHLQRAAKELGTSPSAVSRTIHLLEEQLGFPLFHRTGGNLRLTELGRALLAGTRDAMRVVDDALPADAIAEVSGAVRVSSQGRLTTVYLLPALTRLRRQHPDLIPHITNALASEVTAKLLRGDLDVALVFHPQQDPGVAITRLGAASNGVYCGPGHALYRVDHSSIDDVLTHPFTAPEPRDAGPPLDNWPPNLARKVALFSSLLDGGIDACAAGDLLGVFPDAVVPTFAKGVSLWRIPLDVVRPTDIYAVSRVSVGKHDVAASVIREVRGEVEAIDENRLLST